MSQQRAGFFARHAWRILLGLVLVIGLFGIGDVILGMEADPAIPEAVTGLTPAEIETRSQPLATLVDLQIRSGGLHLILLATLWAVILWIPFRQHERWAWYAMWTFPLWALTVSVAFLFVELRPDAALPPPAISGWVFFGAAGLLLLASRRLVFGDSASVSLSEPSGPLPSAGHHGGSKGANHGRAS